MRNWIVSTLSAFMVLVAVGSAGAQSSRETEIRGVIEAQVQAFLRDDAPAAYAIASPEIQAQFGNPANFIGMVQRGYPEVFRPQKFRFLGLVEEDGRIVQRVLIDGPSGTVVTAVYDMIEIDGRWRINGCQILRGSDA